VKYGVPPTRPKLIQIARAASNNPSDDFRTMPLSSNPQTPRQFPEEISVFSPYDTPGYAADNEIESSPTQLYKELPVTSYSSVSLVPQPLSLLRPPSLDSSCSAFIKARRHLHALAEPFASSTTIEAIGHDPFITALPKPSDDYAHRARARPLGLSPKPSRKRLKPEIIAARDRQDHSRLPPLLSWLECAVKTFTHHSSCSFVQALAALNLSSPMMLDVRCPNVPTSQYVHMLGMVFRQIHSDPHVSTSSFSALVAWIIVDLRLCEHIRTLQAAIAQAGDEQDSHFTHHRAQPSASRFSRPPTFQLFPPSPPHHRDCPRCEATRKEEAQAMDIVNKHHYSFTTIINTCNSSLHRIPTKARDLLGIAQSPHSGSFSDLSSGDARSHQEPSPRSTSSIRRKPLPYPSQPQNSGKENLLRRTIATQASVSVIAKKIVETLRGSSGFDDDIWRILRVLVEVVEEGGWARMQECSGRSSEEVIENWV
jgi:hypothetical protein